MPRRLGEAGLAADVDHHAVAVDQRRRRHAEVALRRLEHLAGIDRPQQLARGEVDAAHHAIRAVGEDAPAGDDRHRARPFVEPEVIAIAGRVVEGPRRLARERVHRFDGLAVVDAMEQDQPSARDGRAGKAGADVTLPDERRTRAGKGRNDLRAGVDAVAARAENLWPVLRLRSEQRHKEKDRHEGHEEKTTKYTNHVFLKRILRDLSAFARLCCKAGYGAISP